MPSFKVMVKRIWENEQCKQYSKTVIARSKKYHGHYSMIYKSLRYNEL